MIYQVLFYYYFALGVGEFLGERGGIAAASFFHGAHGCGDGDPWGAVAHPRHLQKQYDDSGGPARGLLLWQGGFAG